MDKVREAALLCVYDVEYNGAYSNMALKKAINDNRFSHKDAAFLTMLVYGVVGRKITLDYIIEKYSKIKPKKISKYIFQILRLGIYQIYFTDKIPDSAAADECVKLAKRYGHGASAGFVNGVLRNAARNKTIEYPEGGAEYLSVKYSYPLSTAKRWTENFGRDMAEDIMAAQSGEAEMTLRVNRLLARRGDVVKRLEENGICAHECEENEFFIRTGGFDIAGSDIYKEGLVTAQDISAALAVFALAPKPGEDILDICAAPGGKATLCAELMENKGSVTACDIHEHRLELIIKNARRMRTDIIKCEMSDATVFREDFAGKFDRVIADVPCSGSGIIKRKPDIKYKTEENYDMQYPILENAAAYLKRGGRLIYSTCSIERRENEDIVNKFMSEHPEFEYADIWENLPKKFRERAMGGYITIYPTDGSDGFFICGMRKK
ncbi:MAG: 16S rRNA (cytosine(967)-C(5))-methyltransferase RsmB [Oscillospiraceae bacterium]|nr:16S rRNA (cytosine(967)-C(5))-methyltransferase RsmB [Oscillospiraceae bacterium]